MENPILAKETLVAMFAILPTAKDLLTEHRWSHAFREAIAAESFLTEGNHFYAYLARITFKSLKLVMSASASLAKTKNSNFLTQPDFDLEHYAEIITQLDWQPISTVEKESVLCKNAPPCDRVIPPELFNPILNLCPRI